ncbi:MAG: aromatic ring-hydroxylating dioxygenase subunit alpha [Gammaproteobacteria bacterium]|nr:aromatic ring-hydroxylating dioxygenase subunit alpha [Gammaproteobacteria bacterium]
MAEITQDRAVQQVEAESTDGLDIKLSGDLRRLIPKLGLRNYWYPVVGLKRIGSRHPVRVSMLGEALCLFRTEDDDIAAIRDVCPHRGASLSEGDCHWKGTVACPYHGWVFDKDGHNIAVLGEGPGSVVCGKRGTDAKVYPLRVLKGVVFAWIGDEEPAPIEQDVPEEFFDPDTVIYYNDRIHWRTSWEVAIENSMDAHVNYLHRDHLQGMLGSAVPMPRGASGAKIAFTGNGFKSTVARADSPPQDHYENGLVWPKRRIRRYWAWFFRWFFSRTHVPAPAPESDWWGTGHRLPGMFRAGFSPPRTTPDGKRVRPMSGGLFGLYTRWPVAVDDWLTRVWYFSKTRPASKFERIKDWILYWTTYRWLVQYNFSQQDMSVMENIDYESPERLSNTDGEIVQWRRLVVTKHVGGRNAKFAHHGEAVEDLTPPGG